jgi:hypothetical protein
MQNLDVRNVWSMDLCSLIVIKDLKTRRHFASILHQVKCPWTFNFMRQTAGSTIKPPVGVTMPQLWLMAAHQQPGMVVYACIPCYSGS